MLRDKFQSFKGVIKQKFGYYRVYLEYPFHYDPHEVLGVLEVADMRNEYFK